MSVEDRLKTLLKHVRQAVETLETGTENASDKARGILIDAYAECIFQTASHEDLEIIRSQFEKFTAKNEMLNFAARRPKK